MSMNNDIETFCKNVSILMEQNRLSKNEMAKICGISLNDLSKILQGEIPNKVTVEMIYRLLDYFSVKPENLFNEQIK